MKEQVMEWLLELGGVRSEIRTLADNKEAALAEAIPEDVRRRLDEIENEFSAKIDARESRARALERQIKDAVLTLGETIRSTYLMAVYQVRTSWDTKALSGYAAAHPEVMKFMKQTPSVSIRERRKQ